jgi:SPASM domain peptide maturase of grasp-with-spasm system
MTQVFKRIEECQPVKGFRRSAIYDLNRKTYDLIPQALYSILTEYEGKTVQEVKQDFADPAVIDEYFEFLLQKEYIFFCSKEDFSQFSPLILQWDYSALITNAILCLDENSSYDLPEVMNQLENLGCRHVLIFSKAHLDIAYFECLLESLDLSTFQSIEIHTRPHESLHLRSLKNFAGKFPRIRAFIVYSSVADKIYCEQSQPYGIIAFMREEACLTKDPGDSLSDYFNVNIHLFSEAQRHNVFYNRKLIVDVTGTISNTFTGECTDHRVSQSDLKEVVEAPSFQRLWNVSKDSIAVCRDCEFRYMCSDSRIPDQEQGGLWRFESECAYNPYLAKWKGEKDYMPVKSMMGV